MGTGTPREAFRRLRLDRALAMVLLGLGVVTASTLALRGERDAHRAAEARRGEMQGRLAQVHREERELRQKMLRFQELAERGVLGQETRLDWMERIRAVQSARRLFHFQYELAAERPFDTEVARAWDFRASTMKLQMPLLHEEDLLDFLSDLRASVAAHIGVRDCLLERLPKAEDGNLAPLLKADCTLDWVTVRASGAPAPAADARRTTFAPRARGNPASGELGRLFFTPEERSALQRRRLPSSPDLAGDIGMGAGQGMVRRTGGGTTTWRGGVARYDAEPERP